MERNGLQELRVRRGRAVLSDAHVQVLRQPDDRSWRVLPSLPDAVQRNVHRPATTLSEYSRGMHLDVRTRIRQ